MSEAGEAGEAGEQEACDDYMVDLQSPSRLCQCGSPKSAHLFTGKRRLSRGSVLRLAQAFDGGQSVTSEGKWAAYAELGMPGSVVEQERELRLKMARELISSGLVKAEREVFEAQAQRLSVSAAAPRKAGDTPRSSGSTCAPSLRSSSSASTPISQPGIQELEPVEALPGPQAPPALGERAQAQLAAPGREPAQQPVAPAPPPPPAAEAPERGPSEDTEPRPAPQVRGSRAAFEKVRQHWTQAARDAEGRSDEEKAVAAARAAAIRQRREEQAAAARQKEEAEAAAQKEAEERALEEELLRKAAQDEELLRKAEQLEEELRQKAAQDRAVEEQLLRKAAEERAREEEALRKAARDRELKRQAELARIEQRQAARLKRIQQREEEVRRQAERREQLELEKAAALAARRTVSIECHCGGLLMVAPAELETLQRYVPQYTEKPASELLELLPRLRMGAWLQGSRHLFSAPGRANSAPHAPVPRAL